MDKQTRKLTGRAPARDSQKSGTFLEHLEELARRVRASAIVLLVFAALGLFFAEPILQFLIIHYGKPLQTLGPSEGISTTIRVGLTFGLAATSPYIAYQIIAFIRPGLEPREKRPIYFVVPTAFILFLGGAAFAWYILIPPAVELLENFLPNIFRNEWTAKEYVAFVLSLVLWIGIAFEMPLVFMFLGRLGIVSPRLLLKQWRIAVVAIAVVAAAITPTVDPFTMLLTMGPLIALYFLSILLTAFTYRKQQTHS
ncbi:MAG TPA: twin-arginine translocase subunit TatC [Anaerolineales bacterium]|nr:twin-arginine translocase subunit TatC [Anaerolineales bacterium]